MNIVKELATFKVILLVIILGSTASTASYGETGKFVLKVITLDNRARLCKKPGCLENTEILRMPTNSVLTSHESTTVKTGLVTSRWYKVTYRNKNGWISEYDLKIEK